MPAYIVRRVLAGIMLLFALTFVTFSISKLVPSDLDPGCQVLYCGQNSLAQPAATPAQLKAVDHRLGLDRPLYVQYGKFVWRLVSERSFGKSLQGQPLNAELRVTLAVTGSIVLGGIVLLLLITVPLGAFSAVRAHTRSDRLILFFSVIGIALHPLVVGYLLRRAFSHGLHFFPAFGYCPLFGRGYLPVTGHTSGGVPVTCGGFSDWSSHLALPWLTFALFHVPLYTRIVRGRVLESLSQPHVATARAKGASEVRVLRRHVLRLALLPLIPMVAMDIGGALMTAIYIEVSFGLAGLGAVVLNLLESDHAGFDVPTIVAVFFVVGALIILANLVADIVHYLFEPRERYAPASA